MTAHRAATVRFYFDADVLGLAKVIAALRPDATYPGDPGAVIHKRLRPPCRIEKPATPDHVWIPVVAQEGWVIITRDSRIQHHRAEVLRSTRTAPRWSRSPEPMRAALGFSSRSS